MDTIKFRNMENSAPITIEDTMRFLNSSKTPAHTPTKTNTEKEG